MSEALKNHPDPYTYWMILRWMSILSAVLFVAGSIYGVFSELSEGQRETLNQSLWTLGIVWLAYVSLSQGVEALNTLVSKR